MRPEDLPRFRQSPTDPAFVQDPNPTYARMRALGPAVFWEDYGHAVFTRHAQVSALLRDRRFGREVTHLASRQALGWDPIPDRLAPFYAVEAHSLLEREPPAHTRLRRLVNRAFTSRAIAGLAPRIEAEARRLVDAMPAGPDAPFDLVPAFAEPLPMAVIGDMLGVLPQERDKLLQWSDDLVCGLSSTVDELTIQKLMEAWDARNDRTAYSEADIHQYTTELWLSLQQYEQQMRE